MTRFRVDLHGLVGLLSRSLYSSPRVFVRELLQNAVDAITERRLLDPGTGGRVLIECSPDGAVRFADDGVGLTEHEVVTLLATIGSSSKRDELDFQRAGLLGQFGIGLLACFLVSDEIDVVTRSAREPDAPTVHWIGNGDGTYRLATDGQERAEPGTTVTLRPRPGEEWLRPALVRDLATTYGALLPVTIEVHDRSGTPDQTTDVAPRLAPWELDADGAATWCHRHFGFLPAAAIPLDVPVAGVRGVAFVRPHESNPTEPSRPRVYLRRMLLGEAVEGLLPDWAYFVRAVLDVEGLTPTASREALQDDGTTAAARTELGRQLRQWFVTVAAEDPDLLHWVLDKHGLALRAASLHDDELLAIVRDRMPWPSTAGAGTLADHLATSRTLTYAATVEDYDAIAPVAAAQGLTVLTAGYVYQLAVLTRLAETDPTVTLRAVSPADVLERLGGAAGLPGADRLARVARTAVPDAFCDVAVRVFAPGDTPALYLPDPGAAAHEIAGTTLAGAADSDAFAGLVEPPPVPERTTRALLVLNAGNELVRRLALTADETVADVVAALYVVALQAAGGPTRRLDPALLTRALVRLVERADG